MNVLSVVTDHITKVLGGGMQANSEEEFKTEKRYLQYIFVSIGCFFMPLSFVFRYHYANPSIQDDDGGGKDDTFGQKGYRGLQIACELSLH